MTRHVCLAAALLLVGSTTSALAGTRSLAIDSARILERQDGAARLVLKVEDLSYLQGRIVKSATLEIPLPGGRAAGRDLNLHVYAAARPWSPGTVTWDSPWTRAGGDWTLDHYSITSVGAGERPSVLRFDVSAIVREVAAGREANLGFFVLPGGGEEGGVFDSTDRELLGSLSGARLEVNSTRGPRNRPTG